MVFRPGQGPMDQTRETQRQAEIRELYGKVSRLEEYINTNVQVQAEAPQPIVLSPVVNYLDNSDFRLSISEYVPATTIANPCTVIDKWYQSENLSYTLHDHVTPTVSPNAITETSDGVRWNPFSNILIMNGGSTFATPLFDSFASSGNSLYFRMQLIHRPMNFYVIDFTDAGTLTLGVDKAESEATVFDSLANGQLISFFNNPAVAPAIIYKKPASTEFFTTYKISDLTVASPPTEQTIGGVVYRTATLKLKNRVDNSYITGMGTFTYNPSTPAERVLIYTAPYPNIAIKVSVLEGDDNDPSKDYLEDDEGKRAQLVIINSFQNVITTFSQEIVGLLTVPVLENPFNRPKQWLQIRFLNDTNPSDNSDTLVTNVEMPKGTIWIDKVALSSTYGSWSPSFRDSSYAVTCVRSNPDGEVIIGGGGGGIVALPPPPDGGGIEQTYLPGIPQLPPPTRGGTF